MMEIQEQNGFAEERAVMNLDNKLSGKAQNRKRKQSKSLSNLGNWFFGFAISLIPLAMLPIYKAVNGEDMNGLIVRIISGAELLYVGISLAVTSMNDFEGHSNWNFKLHIIMLIIGVMVYGFASIAYQTSEESRYNPFTLWFNICFLIVITVISVTHYVTEYRNGN